MGLLNFINNLSNMSRDEFVPFRVKFELDIEKILKDFWNFEAKNNKELYDLIDYKNIEEDDEGSRETARFLISGAYSFTWVTGNAVFDENYKTFKSSMYFNEYLYFPILKKENCSPCITFGSDTDGLIHGYYKLTFASGLNREDKTITKIPFITFANFFTTLNEDQFTIREKALKECGLKIGDDYEIFNDYMKIQIDRLP